jgi:hypothetical protein
MVQDPTIYMIYEHQYRDNSPETNVTPLKNKTEIFV